MPRFIAPLGHTPETKNIRSSSNLVIRAQNAVVDANADITLDAGGDEIIFKDGNSSIGQINMGSDNLTIKSLVSDKDIILQGNDGGSEITALTLDMSAAGKATFNNEIVSGAVITSGAGLLIANNGTIGSASDADAITIASDGVVTMNQIPVFSAGINVSGGTIAGTLATAAQTNITSLGTLTALTVDDINLNGKVVTITGDDNDTFTITTGAAGATTLATTDATGTGGNLTLDADGAINLDAADSGAIYLQDAGSTYGAIFESSDHLYLKSTRSDGDMFFQGNDGGVTINALRIDMSNGGSASFNNDVTVGDDLILITDSSKIWFGVDYDVSLTHVHDTGLLLNAAMVMQFRDSAINIGSPADGDLDINADDEIELNSTLVDINANLDVSGTYTGGGLMTTGGNIVIPDAGTIGSASDTDAIAISSGGVVTMNQIPVFSAGINVSGGNIAGTLSTAAQTNITSLGTLTALQVDNININGNAITSTAGTDLTITPLAGQQIVLDGTIVIDAGVVTGATSITSTAFVGDITGDVTGNADTATTLATARTIGGTSFDGSANIAVALATLATTATVSDSTANTNFPVVFNDESNALLDDTGALRYNPSTGTLLVPNLVVAGTTTQVDTVTMNAANAVVFEGATADDYETTLTIIDPTADRTQRLINQSGYIPLLAAVTTTAITSTPEELNILDGATVVVGEINALDLGSTAVGNAIASKAVILDSSKDYTGIRNLTISGEIDAATGDYSGAVDIAGATTTAAITASGIIKTDDTTAATSTTDGSLQTDGGLSVALDAVIGDDIKLLSDAAVAAFGADGDVTLTHVADTGLLLNAAMAIQFRDSAISIGSTADGDLSIVADDEIDLTSTLIDINGNVDVSGTYQGGGTMTTGGNIVIPDSGTIGSASDTNAIAISSGGVVTVSATTATTSTSSGALVVGGGVGIAKDAVIGDDIIMLSEFAQIAFGADSEITLKHTPDVGLRLTHAAGGDNLPVVFQLKSEEDAIIADEVIASIEFAAGDGSGTDAATVAAGIHAIAEDTFSASANKTKLVFTTGVSETAAASATAKMTLSSAGLLTIADDFVIKDGGTIGSASDTDAIAIAADGVVTMNQIPVFSAGINVSSGTIAGTLATVAQTNITSLGTLTALTVDDVVINGKVITITGDTDDTFTITTGAAGATTIATVDTAGADGILTLDADGIIKLDAGDASGQIRLLGGGTQYGTIFHSGSGANLNIKSIVSDGDINFVGNDGGADVTALTLDMSAAGKATFNDDVVVGDDILLQSDGSRLFFGADFDVILTHIHNSGLRVTRSSSSDDQPVVFQLKSLEGALIADEVIGSLEFAAGDTDGTDGATVAAGIHAIAEDTFSASVNKTKLVFTTGVSETAASSATAKATLSSIGDFTVAGDLIIKDGGTIGSASDLDAIAIASDGVVTMNQIPVFSAGINVSSGTIAGTLSTAAQGNVTSLGTLTTLTVDNIIINGTNIGHTSDTDAMAIASNGVVTFSQIPVMPANSIDSDEYIDGSIDRAHLSADIIDATKIADDAIDSEHYTDGSIDTAHIADNQITLAKMAGIARGKIIYGDASGDPAVLAPGTNAQVLSTDGTDLSWVDISVSSLAADNLTAGDAAILLTTSSGNITIDAAASDSDIIFKGTDGFADITALTLDMSDAGTAIFNHDIELGIDGSLIKFGADNEIALTHVHDTGLLLTDSGGYNIPTLQFVDANESISSDGGHLIFTSNGVAFDFPSADGSDGQVLKTNGSGVLSFVDAGAGGSTAADDIAAGDAAVNITTSSGTITLDAAASDTDIIFKGNDGGSTITALTLDMSDSGKALFNSSVKADYFWMKTNGRWIYFGSSSEINLQHVQNVGLRINNALGNPTLQFEGADESISSDNGHLIFTSNGVTFDFPSADGSAGQALVTNGSGVLSFASTAPAYDDITTGDAAVNITTSSGNITIDAAANDSDIIFKGTDGGADITALTLDMSDAGTAIFNHDIELGIDGSLIKFGADNEILLTHVHDTGLLLTDSGGTPTLQLHDANESISSDGGHLIFTSNGVAFDFPSADGSNGQVLVTNGSGVLSFADGPAVNIADLDIDGTADIGAAIDDADLFIIDDGGGGTNRKTTASRLKSYINAATSATAADDIAAGDAAVTLTTDSGNITIDAAANDTDIILKGTDGGADTTFLTIDGSAAGEATFNAGIVIADAGNIGSASDKDAIAIASDGVVNFTQTPTVASAAVKFAGKESIFIPAAAMYPSTTNGCAALEQVETTALRPDLKCLDFDASSDEFAQFAVSFPKSWNEGTVTFQPFWTVTGTNTGTVAWQLGGIAVSNDDSINTAFGTLVATTALAHSGTSNDLMVSAESGAVTIAGSPAADDQCFFQINRDVSADAQTGDARLLGIKLFFTTDAGNDA